MIRVFIGHDQAENVAFHVMTNSIQRHASEPVAITQIRSNQLHHIHNRPWDEKQSNDFSFTRWLVPYLCDYEGWAIWMDCDMLVMDDIAKLWDQRAYNKAVQVVKHNHVPTEETKYLGRPQTAYTRKNWSSVMLFNCARCRALTPEYVNEANGLDLHQFKWVEKDKVGDIQGRWNYLVGVNDQTEDEKDLDNAPVANAHFTVGGPYFSAYSNAEFAFEWWEELHDTLHCEQAAGELAEMAGEAPETRIEEPLLTSRGTTGE